VSVLGVTCARLLLRWGWKAANACDCSIKCTLIALTCATCHLARQMVTVRLEADVQDDDQPKQRRPSPHKTCRRNKGTRLGENERLDDLQQKLAILSEENLLAHEKAWDRHSDVRRNKEERASTSGIVSQHWQEHCHPSPSQSLRISVQFPRPLLQTIFDLCGRQGHNQTKLGHPMSPRPRDCGVEMLQAEVRMVKSLLLISWPGGIWEATEINIP